MSALQRGTGCARARALGTWQQSRAHASAAQSQHMSSLATQVMRALAARPLASPCALRSVSARARSAQTVADAADSAQTPTSGKGLRRLARLAEKAPTEEAAAPAPETPQPTAKGVPAAPRAPPPSAIDSKMAEALDATLSKLNKRLGANTVSTFGTRSTSFPNMERYSTGVLTLDNVLGGGIPQGRIVEIFGPESSGKTSLALCILSEVQKIGKNVAMIDAEHAFDAAYASQLGLDVENLIFCTPDTGEDALDVVDELCRSGTLGAILVDSVSALIPRTEMERDMGDPQVGSQARLMSNALKRIAQSASKFGTTVIFINQIRMKIGVVYGNPETTSGGMALKYYASQRIDVRKSKHLDGEKDGPANGLKIKAKVVKNKVGAPAGVVYFDVIFAKGVDRTGCLVDAAVVTKAVDRRGAFHYVVRDGEDIKLGQGRDKAIAFLDDPANAEVREYLEVQTKQRLTPGQGLPGELGGSVDEP